jgi:hypothetical protein
MCKETIIKAGNDLRIFGDVFLRGLGNGVISMMSTSESSMSDGPYDYEHDSAKCLQMRDLYDWQKTVGVANRISIGRGLRKGSYAEYIKTREGAFRLMDKMDIGASTEEKS